MLLADARREELASYLNNTLWQLPDGSVPMFAAFPMVNLDLELKL
jgi:hypothetical protein